MLVDSHCHLNYEGLSGQIPSVLARADDAGVLYMGCICRWDIIVLSGEEVLGSWKMVCW